MTGWDVDGGKFINQFAAELQFDAVTAFEDELIKMTDGIVDGTPIGLDMPNKKGGALKSNWQIASKTNSRVFRTSGGSATRLGFAERKIRGKLATVNKRELKKISNKSLFLFNNSPYLGVVEFGGYANPVKKGTYNPRTRSYEKRSSGGFSKQAPRGMVRINVLNYENRIKKRLFG